ncbi:MAG: uracil-DNA glycosylase [Rhodospirillales bacterium]|nr:uracil-DNA glycosylase [Rhodospirillales bacterium]
MPHEPVSPGKNCPDCSRLVEFRAENSKAFPDWHNAPVPAFGSLDASVLICGLAPGKQGANRTGRPFTGDFAGDLLYPTLLKNGFAKGKYGATPNDGLELLDCRITNAVRCVPPENRPTTAEIKACNRFLRDEIAAMPGLRVIIALGTIAHGAIFSSFGFKKSAFPFNHGGMHTLNENIRLYDSYHCSRYNTNTGRLTPEMFDAVVRAARHYVSSPPK